MTTHASPATPNFQLPEAIPLPPLVASDAEEREIPVAEIDPEDNARKHFDRDALQALADNIAANGLLKSIIVYRDPEARRSELMLIDNDQEDLDDVELGLAYLDYTTRYHCTASALAEKLGKYVSTITRRIALVRKLPDDLRAVVGSELPPSVAQLLTSLGDDDAKRRFAGLYRDGTFKSGDELAAAIRAAKKGQAPGSTVGFTADEGGVRIAVTWTTGKTGPSPGKDLAAVEAALRVVLKDLKEQGKRGLESFKEFLSRKAHTAKKSVELEAAQAALARHTGTGGTGGT